MADIENDYGDIIQNGSRLSRNDMTRVMIGLGPDNYIARQQEFEVDTEIINAEIRTLKRGPGKNNEFEKSYETLAEAKQALEQEEIKITKMSMELAGVRTEIERRLKEKEDIFLSSQLKSST